MFLGQLFFNDCIGNWREIDKTIKECERIPPKKYGEYLQKKRRNKKRRGRK